MIVPRKRNFVIMEMTPKILKSGIADAHAENRSKTYSQLVKVTA